MYCFHCSLNCNIPHCFPRQLSDNQLSTLPNELSELKSLQRLTLSHNNLTELPDEAFNLPELRLLKLDHNKLTKLPDVTELTLLDQLVSRSSQCDAGILLAALYFCVYTNCCKRLILDMS